MSAPSATLAPSARETRTYVPVTGLEVRVYRVPTDGPEADGTLEWSESTMVLVRAEAGGKRGLGFSYVNEAAARLIHSRLRREVEGCDPLAVGAVFERMVRAVRNSGRPGIASEAISAVDLALWDLKARLLDLPLALLFGPVRGRVPLYGSGGFTSYSPDRLRRQLGGWAEQGFKRVKMKIGADPARDLERVRAAREAVGPEVELFVDANGAYSRKQALAFAEKFAELGVSWFEEPVSSDDLEGLRLLRDRAPAGMDIAAGEYGYDAAYFRRMLEAGAVDVLQADATRCGGYTGFFRAGALCDAFQIPFSAHTSPSLHLPACCAVPRLRHLEYFYDHARIEHLFFDGAPEPSGGDLAPDLSRPGNGLELKESDAERYRV